MPATRVEIRGLPALQKALKQIDAESGKELKAAFAEIAEGVASAIRPKVPYKSGTAAGSVKSRASTRGGAIAFGGTAAPYYPWLDFGGRVGRHRSIERPFMTEGRYVYPTIGERNPQIRREVDEAIERLARKAGFETHA